jgi:plastocyanin
MSATTRLVVAVAAIAGLSFTAIGAVSHDEARATPAFNIAEAGPTITITNEGVNYTYSPAQLNAKAGQDITVTNKDPNGVHSVTAKDHSFTLDIPPQSSVTLKVSKPGTYPYYCTYHTDAHNAASLNVS